MRVRTTAMIAVTGVSVLVAGSVAAGSATCDPEGRCAAAVPRATTTVRPTASPEMPRPGPIESLRFARGKARLWVRWTKSTSADWYEVRVTRLRLRLVREGGQTKKEYTPFPQPWVEVKGRNKYRVDGPFSAGAKYRVQVRGVNVAGVGPMAVDTYTIPCRIVRSRCAVEGR